MSLNLAKTLAVVVTYHPEQSFPARIARLIGQVNSIVIVDNHSNPQAIAMLHETSSRNGVKLILNSDNLGIATALNLGVSYAIASQYEWALLLDQDTEPAAEMVESLMAVYERIGDKQQVAVIGSNYLDPKTKKPSITPKTDYSWCETKTVITSGSLISLRAFTAIGPFRDEYFIDCVDLEYCLRARSKGFRIVLTSKPLMTHDFGESARHRLLWKETAASNYSPVRRYYMVRNHVALAREYLLKEPLCVLSNLKKLAKSLIVSLIFETRRLPKARLATVGLWDGLLANFGRKLDSASLSGG